MVVLLTGGTGFIGSHTAVELLSAGHQVVLYDNFSNSSPSIAEAIRTVTNVSPILVRGDVRDTVLMTKILRRYNVQAVIHFAGLKSVSRSHQEPLAYCSNNVGGTLSLLQAMQLANIRTLIFSSSATVYGDSAEMPVSESHPFGLPTSPYARNKQEVESLLSDLARADASWSITALRYFNPVGAHPSGFLGERPTGHPNNLFPYLTRVASGRLPVVRVYGNDYLTPDGTAIRDYVHVVDVARAHVLALARAEANHGFEAFNLGTGKGYSVMDVIKAFERASGKAIPFEMAPRRQGDVGRCLADPSKANQILRWSAQYDLNDMCATAWRFEQNHLRSNTSSS